MSSLSPRYKLNQSELLHIKGFTINLAVQAIKRLDLTQLYIETVDVHLEKMCICIYGMPIY